MDMKHKVLSGSELFEFGGSPLPASIKDFWAWSMSWLIADGPRGDLAEFIVNTALGMDMSEPKRGWGECDILYPHEGRTIRIEVKCSTLLQAWERPSPPKPVFSIAKTLNCDIEDTGGGYRYISRAAPPQRRRWALSAQYQTLTQEEHQLAFFHHTQGFLKLPPSRCTPSFLFPPCIVRGMI